MSDVQRVVNPLCTVAVPDPTRVMVRATDQGQKAEGSETVAPTEGLSGTHEGPARQTQQVGRARDPGSLQYSSSEGIEAVVPTEGLSGTPEGPARQTHQVGRARDPASLQDSSRSQQGLHWGANREAWEQPSPLGTVAVPEPARATVRATDQGHQAQDEGWPRLGAMVYALRMSQA